MDLESGQIQICTANSRQLWDKTAYGISPIALKSLETMVRAQPAKNALQASATRSPSSWSIGVRNRCAPYLPRRNKSSLSSDEARGRTQASSTLRLRDSPGRQRALALGESADGHAEAVLRHVEIANLLAKRICRKLSIGDPPGSASARSRFLVRRLRLSVYRSGVGSGTNSRNRAPAAPSAQIRKTSSPPGTRGSIVTLIAKTTRHKTERTKRR